MKRRIKGRKIPNRKTREITLKRLRTRRINDQCMQCIYMMIQSDFKQHFQKNLSKKEGLTTFQKWWISPYTSHHYSMAQGVASGVNWALHHLLKTGTIDNIEYNKLMPVIYETNEKSHKFIRFWNPKHSVGARVWPTILEFVELFKELSENEATEIIELCKTTNLKKINKSLKNKS